jgi:hypothetical protein
MSGLKTRPCSAIPNSPTAHAPPGTNATALRSLSRGSARLLNVLQTAPFHCATKALEWGEVDTVEPTATALLDDRAATPPNPPGTDGMSSRECWPFVPAADALAMGKVAHASLKAAGGEAAGGEAAEGDAVHASVKTATARFPARLMGFICSPWGPCHH